MSTADQSAPFRTSVYPHQIRWAPTDVQTYPTVRVAMDNSALGLPTGAGGVWEPAVLAPELPFTIIPDYWAQAGNFHPSGYWPRFWDSAWGAPFFAGSPGRFATVWIWLFNELILENEPFVIDDAFVLSQKPHGPRSPIFLGADFLQLQWPNTRVALDSRALG